MGIICPTWACFAQLRVEVRSGKIFIQLENKLMQLLTEIQAECCEPLILNILALNLVIVLLLNQFFSLN